MLSAPVNSPKCPFARNWLLLLVSLWLGQWTILADQSVTLTWSPSTDPEAAGYKIYYGGASGVYTNTVSVGSATAQTVSGLSDGTTYYFSATTVSVSGNESPFSNEATYVIPAAETNPPTTSQSNTNTVTANPMPSVDAVADFTIYQNAGLQTVSLTGIASGLTNGYQSISLWAYSSDETVIPAPTVNYTSPNDTGTLTFAPVANALGTATVQVKLNNGVNNFTETFIVTVVPAPSPVTSQPPTLGALTNLTVHQNAGVQTVNLTDIGAGSASGSSLVVSAISSDTTVLPTPTVHYTSPNTTGTLTFTPVTNALGTATLTVIVDNGAASNNLVSQAFMVTVLPAPVVVPPPAVGTNLGPTLDPIANIHVLQGTMSQPIVLTGISGGPAPGKSPLKVTATSTNPRMVPAPVIRSVNPAGTASVALRLSPAQTGVATITVTVNNGAKSNNIVRQTFTVTVVPPAPPALDPIADVSVASPSGLQSIQLTGIAGNSSNQVLKVSASCSNPRAFMPRIQYASPASTALLTFTPAAHFTGTATVTVTVSDGNKYNGSVRQRFAVTVAPAVTGHPAVSVVRSPTEADQMAILTPLGKVDGKFSFQVTGLRGSNYIVQTTSDMVRWTSVQTNAAPFSFQDNTETANQRFYRAQYLP